MAIGSHVFRQNRVGLWVIPNANLTDKLKHVLPRARRAIPNLTDIFLPPQAQVSHKDQVRSANFFAHTYDVVHADAPDFMAKKMLADRRRLGTGAIEIDLEGAAVQPDIPALAAWAREFVRVVRLTNPNLPIRFNVPPFKGYALPGDLIVEDPQLFVIAQTYFGNQDGKLAEDAVLLDLLDYGVPRDKAKVMYGVMNDNPQGVRVYTLPNPEYKPITEGSVFSDDLLIDSGALGA